ncbi:hypothetical protein SELR_25370 [Selenomonas ruminantium subsp. lactilytica TAM6421]|jgi:hypothetical protein|uniref:Uncharacterized protein n=1 Tax=Selenomonas ruminantium subsp. lactilytica (strain NBRC 103574 / TAM6421) TaxID=927704 RepID=I0GU08_SELRL|nr:hypothetical protein [Selenomonas ruminantium]BAL84245.1 hypothetical protein SELR_25370 [Selenomonas ruminantium subsp. lactilytica TAM6421]
MENEKTFTQEEVNKIVSSRLKEERAKMEKEFSAKMLNEKARGILKEKGFNPDLANALKYDSEETLMQSIELLGGGERIQKPGYNPNSGSGNVKPKDSIREAFGLPSGRNYSEEVGAH